MPRFAANLSMMYQEHAFLDRFAAAAKDGFEGVEFLFPYEYDKHPLRARLVDHGLTQVFVVFDDHNVQMGSHSSNLTLESSGW